VQTNKIIPSTILSDEQIKFIDFLKQKVDVAQLKNILVNTFNIDSTDCIDTITQYATDWSNINGSADLLVKPKTTNECAVILRLASTIGYSVTVSAGRTNLTGSATPRGGIILSIENLNEYKVEIDYNKMQVSCSPNLYLESLRNEVLSSTDNKLYYPVDPTSRVDAMVSGTISCNASGFIPGEKGATRYWVKGIDVVFAWGEHLYVKRGQYISNNGKFSIHSNNKVIDLRIPNYQRPKIKNASGPYSDSDNEIDLIDLIIGSEGIFCFISRCELKLDRKPTRYIDLFIGLKCEDDAIKLHECIGKILNNNFGNISALEYFGYNCSGFMKNREYLFKSDDDVGVYLQSPVLNECSYDDELEIWYSRLSELDIDIDLDKVLVLNEPSNWKLFFEARHSLPVNALERAKELGTVSVITDTIVPPQNFKKYLLFVHNIIQKNKIEYLLFGHLGDCHLHFHLLPSKENEKQALEVYRRIVQQSTKLGGVYSAEHGTGKRKRNDFIECYGEKAAEQVINIKKIFDPSMILNIGNVVSV